MSVFTPVARAELEAFLGRFTLGRLIDYHGIAGGTENSNFFVTTVQGEYVLTLVERGPMAELPFFIALLDHLQRAQLPVPYAIRDRDGAPLHQLNGRPALLQPRLPGRHVDTADASHCRAIGQLLARLHDATATSGLLRPSDRGLEWMATQTRALAARSEPADRELLHSMLPMLDRLRAQRPALPEAVLHGDLFRDNVLFDGHHLTGIIDFYNAFSGWTLYDVAICVNDWCLAADGGLDERRTEALLAGYASQRRFTPLEAEHWPDLLRLAALRFWLSRQLAADQHTEHYDVLIKDPVHFQRLLAAHRDVQLGLPLAL
ncbi:homoserine kinase [Pseudomonas saudimassiliensis]|uniref:Homoserine kinase n=1 Tax=Pseudomonas saudimassiliensis TaxID=1461581 RepID=A0A078MEU2_9PSED|nr:homoserine kinase [Pseudomonas saudimassiliensis]CEA04765.1 homoserine kinase [Pseudomonas saudimassiliensis]CEF26784.1 homoserine kinase [Pseudomonas saudimassiliensis]